MKKQFNINFILYQTISTILFSFLVCNNYFIHINSKIAFFYPIILSIGSIILFLILPSKTTFTYKEKSIINICLSLYYVISSSLIICLSSYIIIFYFFGNMSYLLLALLLSLMCLLFSLFDIKVIYNVSILIFAICIILSSILLFNTSFFNIELLHNIQLNSLFKSKFVYIFTWRTKFAVVRSGYRTTLQI